MKVVPEDVSTAPLSGLVRAPQLTAVHEAREREREERSTLQHTVYCIADYFHELLIDFSKKMVYRQSIFGIDGFVLRLYALYVLYKRTHAENPKKTLMGEHVNNSYYWFSLFHDIYTV